MLVYLLIIELYFCESKIKSGGPTGPPLLISTAHAIHDGSLVSI